MIPIISGKAPSPGTLKTGLIILLKHLPKYATKLVWLSKFVAIKKGNKEGRTALYQSKIPDLAA